VPSSRQRCTPRHGAGPRTGASGSARQRPEKAERADAHFAAALWRTGSAVRERVMAAIVEQKGGEEEALVVQFEQMVRNGEADLQAP